jgi:hypothetical protein
MKLETQNKFMWTCPKCKREFKNRNQGHSCGDFTINQVFEKYSPEIFELFSIIYKLVKSFGDMQISPVKSGVMFTANTTFLALKPHSKYLSVEFASGNAYDEFPIEKCVQISKTEFAHILRIENKFEIDSQISDWLSEAYQFNKQYKK